MTRGIIGKVTSVKEGSIKDQIGHCDQNIQLYNMDIDVESSFIVNTGVDFARVGDIMTVYLASGGKPYFWHNHTTGKSVNCGKNGEGLFVLFSTLSAAGIVFGLLPLLAGAGMILMDLVRYGSIQAAGGPILLGLGLIPIAFMALTNKTFFGHINRQGHKRRDAAEKSANAHAEAIKRSKERRRAAVDAL